RQSGGPLTRKKRQRKIPGTEAAKYPAALQRQLVRLAGGALEAFGSRKMLARLQRILAAIIDCLTHFGNGIRDRLARFSHQQFVKRRAVGLQRIRRPLEAIRARIAARVVPTWSRRSAGLVTARVSPDNNSPLMIGPAVGASAGFLARGVEISARNV